MLLKATCHDPAEQNRNAEGVLPHHLVQRGIQHHLHEPTRMCQMIISPQAAAVVSESLRSSLNPYAASLNDIHLALALYNSLETRQPLSRVAWSTDLCVIAPDAL